MLTGMASFASPTLSTWLRYGLVQAAVMAPHRAAALPGTSTAMVPFVLLTLSS